MRPISLKLKGFTSFRDEQELDFSDLDLFVLWGPTGSGKSSILDAMTYALFGYVDRVGNQAVQLISQGQPRMAVTLDFAIGPSTYRVTRTTIASGGSKVRLERKEGADWVTHDEGADQVREANRMIIKLVGLDYDAFTRSVILPQGKFAEFLAGDAPKRREILTDLLGLELFKRMAQRANEIAKTARLHADIKEESLDREYTGVNDDALVSARGHAVATSQMVASAKELETSLTVLEERWLEADRSIQAVNACATETATVGETYASHAFQLEDQGRVIKGAEDALVAAKQSAADADTAADVAAKARAEAESQWGTLESLATVRSRAESQREVRKEMDDATVAMDNERRKLAEGEAKLSEADKKLATTLKARDEAAAILEAAEKEHHEAHSRDQVGALVADLAPGDPCPVCERPLESLPAADRAALGAAQDALKNANKMMDEARESASAAEKQQAIGREVLAAAKESVARCDNELKTRKEKVDRLVAALAEALGKELPDDPVTVVEERTTKLRALVEAETTALSVRSNSLELVRERELEAERAAAKVAEIRAAMQGGAVDGLLRRVADAAPDLDVPEALPKMLPEEAPELATVAAAAAKEFQKLADDLTSIAAAHAHRQKELLEEAFAALPDGVATQGTSIKELVARARLAVTEAATEAARAEDAVKELEKRLAARLKLEQEIETHRNEHATYSALGKELKSDRIVQFLQAEALAALAAAATEHLRDLSSGRYRLSYEDDRFFVVDSWNGDERRHVKTLSGGETFLASLALALSLSEQVQVLAITERNRLESLFLDEGFGTLDAETLEIVVTAIEQLGGDGRLVGIITHVAELAERLPVRFEITKSPRGSAIRRQDAGFTLA